ncbi:MAG: hypothetical protein MPJ78_02060 [Hyphomicrobiaceae bacterium]|nr:hypothetical protein [Hyphomicrobiaceae bacterium]
MTPTETISLFNKGKRDWNKRIHSILMQRRDLIERDLWQGKFITKDTYEPGPERIAWNEDAIADFSGHVFEEDVDFRGYRFIVANFRGCQFLGDVNLAACDFIPGSEIDEGGFFTILSCAGAEFQGAANFSMVAGPFDAHFNGAKFFSRADFSGASIERLNLNDTNFEDDVNFNGTRLCGLFAGDTRFGKNVNFESAKITSGLYMKGAKFFGHVDCRNFEPPPYVVIDLKNAEFKEGMPQEISDHISQEKSGWYQ